ncbi:ATP synthase F1 subunit delta [Cutibacterium equinum]|uniref:ATP synthase subunit delta n=1 Tax=Cutibacterium equinum TaxID=3016342 RepID=A0ABY7R222_9ACTN|nr:ATP synthase F1 subunit delta [Cutibacterium equinum]WCC80924.1 ATP synthase F1 subunit delta [Cutibacterium equinum]
MTTVVSASRQLDDAGDRLDATVEFASEIFAVVDILARERGLRRSLSDTSSEAKARQRLVDAVFGSKVSADCKELLDATTTCTWRSPVALTRALERQGVRAVLRRAQQADRLETVADELFGINRLVRGQASLQMAIADPNRSGQDRQELLTTLVGDRVGEDTLLLARRAVVSSEASFEHVVDGYLGIASELAERKRAIVTTARALTDAQRAEMVKQLERITGSPIELSEIVDPAVLGGALINLGDEVIDSTVAHRLDQARQELG